MRVSDVLVLYIYIYIYIYRERERERERLVKLKYNKVSRNKFVNIKLD